MGQHEDLFFPEMGKAIQEAPTNEEGLSQVGAGLACALSETPTKGTSCIDSECFRPKPESQDVPSRKKLPKS
jgi:hypothetical protein